MKKISLVIPCYNVAEYLDRCWDSVKNQTIGLDCLECIFVNDASTDNGNTWNKLVQFEKEAPESVMIIDLEENVGQGEARNIGITNASGEYLEFLDADDELVETTCQELYELASKNNVDIIQFNHLFILGDQRKSSESSSEDKLYVIDDKKDRIPFLNATKVTYGCTNKLYKLDLIRKAQVQFPSHCKYEEPLFVYPLFLYANRVYLLNKEYYLYYFREGSTVTSQIGKRILDHPKVQLMLLEYLLARKELFEEYRDVIEIYFLWTFYCETISFAGNYAGAVIPLEYFKYMQEVCNSFFANWKNNPHISMIPSGGRDVLESVGRTFSTQKELDEYIYSVRDLF